MSTSTATPSATISRTAAKSKATDIRRAASRVTALVDTVAANPEWAEQHRAHVDRSLADFLAEIEDLTASLRKGLAL